MKQLFVTSVLCVFLLNHGGNASILDWVWNTKPVESNDVIVAEGVPLIAIPYESMTEDEKFLQEAAKFSEIQASSALDTCQHKVVMKIKTSCGDMTEEELAKMSVSLLNCQSAAEGRKMFPCTEEMTLRQCTMEMDPDMWNAYHLMSNRARAVCYAARNKQFRALTELTVNKLMHSAHSQIQAMGSLKESQERLEEQTVEALNSVSAGNKALLVQQEALKDAQSSAHSLVQKNLQILNSEKALIRSGHAQLIAMTDEIKKKLEKATQELADHSIERNENHKEVLSDLRNMQEQAQVIWSKIESSTNRIMEQNLEAAGQYEETLKQLDQINQTVHFLLDLTNTLRAEVDHKLGWIANYLGDTGDQFEKVYRTGLHVLYLVLAMVIASFLQMPFITRLTIIGILPINLLSYLKEGLEACLDFPSITVLIFLITGMHYSIVFLHYMMKPKNTEIKSTKTASVANMPGANSTPILSVNGHGARSRSTEPKTKGSILSRMYNNIIGIPSALIYELNRCGNTISSCIRTLPLWNRAKDSVMLAEEMSCSYLPAKKSREELVTRYVGNHANDNMSNDMLYLPSDSPDLRNEKYDDFNETEDLLDAAELRRRVTRNGSVPRSQYNYTPSPSRGNTPSFVSPRAQCSALTKTGKQCRLNSSSGQNFCYRHTNGSSFMGD